MGRWQDMLWHSDPWCGHQLSQHSTLCQGLCINGVTQYNPACRLCNMSDMKEGVKNFCFKQILNIHFFPSHAFKLSSRGIICTAPYTLHMLCGSRSRVGSIAQSAPGRGGGDQWVSRYTGSRPTCDTSWQWRRHVAHVRYNIILGECWMCSIMISHFRNIKYLAHKDPHWHGDA